MCVRRFFSNSFFSIGIRLADTLFQHFDSCRCWIQWTFFLSNLFYERCEYGTEMKTNLFLVGFGVLCTLGASSPLLPPHKRILYVSALFLLCRQINSHDSTKKQDEVVVSATAVLHRNRRRTTVMWHKGQIFTWSRHLSHHSKFYIFWSKALIQHASVASNTKLNVAERIWNSIESDKNWTIELSKKRNAAPISRMAFLQLLNYG